MDLLLKKQGYYGYVCYEDPQTRKIFLKIWAGKVTKKISYMSYNALHAAVDRFLKSELTYYSDMQRSFTIFYVDLTGALTGATSSVSESNFQT